MFHARSQTFQTEGQEELEKGENVPVPTIVTTVQIATGSITITQVSTVDVGFLPASMMDVLWTIIGDFWPEKNTKIAKCANISLRSGKFPA